MYESHRGYANKTKDFSTPKGTMIPMTKEEFRELSKRLSKLKKH